MEYIKNRKLEKQVGNVFCLAGICPVPALSTHETYTCVWLYFQRLREEKREERRRRELEKKRLREEEKRKRREEDRCKRKEADKQKRAEKDVRIKVTVAAQLHQVRTPATEVSLKPPTAASQSNPSPQFPLSFL